jgi:cardiolipin synthase
MIEPFAAYLVSHALAVVAVLASLVMGVRLFETRRTPQSTFAWLLGFIFAPFVAIPLYLLLGSRKFPRRAKGPAREPERPSAVEDELEQAAKEAKEMKDAVSPIARVLRASGVASPRPGNAFELLTTGEAAYARVMGLVRGAERSIDVTMFILGDDETGRAVVEAIAERARKGVRVRLILDAVGSSSSLRHAARVLGAAGAEVRTFMPLRHSPIRGRTNLRSHRKLGVFDGAHVFAGGMNFADEYMGPPASASRAPRWRDVAAVASGRVAADAEALFESDWVFCGGSKRAPRDGGASGANAAEGAKGEDDARGDAIVQVVPSGPDMATDTVYDVFLTGIFGAKERVAIVTPYYVPDEVLQHALVLAARRGVRTEIVVPSRSNHRIADVARRSLLRELSAAGVVIHYYARGMVHAKAMMIDDAFAYVGSPNFDMRSLFLNYENALCVYSPAAIGEIRAFVDGLIAECVREPPKQRANWLIEQVARLLAPEL